jgi:hypothetical protein
MLSSTASHMEHRNENTMETAKNRTSSEIMGCRSPGS